MSPSKNIENSFKEIALFYNVSIDKIKQVLDNEFKNVSFDEEKRESVEDIILPFNERIDTNCCKAIIYNHGLYTQCTKETSNEICKSCLKLKYGRVEERIKSKRGEFITPQGKKEMQYEKFIAKMGYNIDNVKEALKLANISYDIKEVEEAPKKGRGRPKKSKSKDSEDEMEEIEVRKIEVYGEKYFKTSENILLKIDTQEVVGVLIDGRIDMIEDE